MVGKLSLELKRFYDAINSKKITNSKLYYHTIINLLNSGSNFIEIDDLENILNKETHYIKDLEVKKTLIEYISAFYDLVSKNKLEEAYNYANIIYTILENGNYEISILDFKNHLKERVERLELEENVKDSIDKAYYFGMSLIENISEKDIPVINEIIDSIPNVKFIIASKDTVAIKNVLDKKEKINSLELYNLAQTLYFQKKYKSCLDVLLTILKNHKVKVNIYGKIGLCYMKLGQTNVAIEYLKLATLLNVENNPKYDYTDLIFNLQNKKNNENKNIRFKVLEEEFKDNIDDYYGVDSINDIIYLVNKGYSIENACFMLNLSNEQIDLVYLIYARECFYNMDYRNGDKYLKIVLKNDKKTEYVKEVLNIVNINKYYYLYRKTNINRPVILKLNK